MIIGVPKEVKDNENRVALTPGGVAALKEDGHTLLIETGAGIGSSFSDEEYQATGASIVDHPADLWSQSEIVLKVKEPLPSEYPFFRKGLVLFTYLHLAAAPELSRQLLDKGVTAIGYETIQLPNGSLPLLTPMSEIAGRMATQVGAQFLEKEHGGKGILLGGVPGVHPAHVVVVGGGVVGTNAAKIAIGMGARVTIFDKSHERLQYLDDLFGNRAQTVASTPYAMAETVPTADLLIGAVLIPGSKAPKIVSETMVKSMSRGSVIVDVAIDQGGSVATIDRVTTHTNPTYERYGVVHYAVANMPGAVPRTSTLALTNATLPYVLRLASQGPNKAALDPVLSGGFNLVHGHVTHEAVAKSLAMPYTPLENAFQ